MGQDVEYGESPWTVSIIYDDFDAWRQMSCTGTIINKQWIITAAHCNYRKSSHNQNIFTRIRVFVGNSHRRGTIVRVFSDQIYRHPKYRLRNRLSVYDIALYKLNYDISDRINRSIRQSFKMIENLVNTVCLPHEWDPEFNSERQFATMFGWGHIDAPGHSPHILQSGQFLLESNRYCRNMFLCTQFSLQSPHPMKTRGCAGDSGAGLVQYTDWHRTRAILIGVYVGHSGSHYCNESIVGLFWVSVVKHIDWIIETIEDNS
ncbi:chymotrypsin-like elastase family member 2A [Oppia nitens]|uniref:chymotrypsin-like elastase family member 2A n=1 Tax=Oppia nitens TaxID=1686743 RepID=UPI0023DCB0E1|nr:chymotrypsin-like elastase family member 2A [Oppia nitens]